MAHVRLARAAAALSGPGTHAEAAAQPQEPPRGPAPPPAGRPCRRAPAAHSAPARTGGDMQDWLRTRRRAGTPRRSPRASRVSRSRRTAPAPRPKVRGRSRRAAAPAQAQARGREDGGRVQNGGASGVLQEIFEGELPSGREGAGRVQSHYRQRGFNQHRGRFCSGEAGQHGSDLRCESGICCTASRCPQQRICWSHRGQTGRHGRLAVLSTWSSPSRARHREDEGPRLAFLSGRVCLSVPNVDLPPLCSSRFRSGPPGEEAQVASQFVADVVENSQMVQKEDLCISPGKLAWVLYCDLICLDYDGNVLDACVFALLAALKNVQLPEVTINEETALAEVNLKKKSHLNIRTHPVATSFAVFDDSLLIVDPTGEEERLAAGALTVVTDEASRLCCLHKPGGSGLTGAKLQDCMSRAVTRHKEVKKLMDEVMKSMKPK